MLQGSDVHSALEAASEGAVVCENLHQSQHIASDDHYFLFAKNYTLQVFKF